MLKLGLNLGFGRVYRAMFATSKIFKILKFETNKEMIKFMRLRKNEINSKFSLTFVIYGINFDIYDAPKFHSVVLL